MLMGPVLAARLGHRGEEIGWSAWACALAFDMGYAMIEDKEAGDLGVGFRFLSRAEYDAVLKERDMQAAPAMASEGRAVDHEAAIARAVAAHTTCMRAICCDYLRLTMAADAAALRTEDWDEVGGVDRMLGKYMVGDLEPSEVDQMAPMCCRIGDTLYYVKRIVTHKQTLDAGHYAFGRQMLGHLATAYAQLRTEQGHNGYTLMWMPEMSLRCENYIWELFLYAYVARPLRRVDVATPDKRSAEPLKGDNKEEGV